MKMLKKVLSLGIMASMLFLSGCSIGTKPSDKTSESTISSTQTSREDETPIVKISSLAAGEVELMDPAEKALHRLGENTSSKEESLTEDTSEDIISSSEEEPEPEDKIQYIVIYKSVKEITFTIKLDNPEAVGIDAVRLYCDDEDAKIQIDGEYKPLAYESDKTRVVNWASEDAYEKTYYIQLSSEEYLNTLAVKDIRLAGHSKFQSKEVDVDNLGKNELRIYKMDDSEFVWSDLGNTTKAYTFSLTIGPRIKNFAISGSEGLTNEGNIYTVSKYSWIPVDYDYVFDDGLVEHVYLERTIQLIKFTQLGNKILEANGLDIDISGTLSETIKEIPVYDSEYNYLATCIRSSMGGWYTEQHIHFEDYSTVIIEVLGAKYSINTNNQILLLD